MKSLAHSDLQDAIANQDHALIRKAIAAGADLNRRERNGHSLLHDCAQHGDVDLFSALHATGLDLREPNKSKNQPIHIAAASHQHEIVDYCLKHGADANAPGEGGWPPLFFACRNGDLDSVRFLIAGGAELNGRSGYKGESALFPAVQANRTHIVNALLDAGADIHQRQTGGVRQTALDVACLVGGDMLTLLLARGADPNGVDEHGRSALFSAITARKLDSLKILAKHGGRLDVASGNGRTLLMEAMWMDNPDIVHWLLDHGVDPQVKNHQGLHAMHIAKRPDAPAAQALQARLTLMGISLDSSTDGYVIEQFRAARAKFERREIPAFEVGLHGIELDFVHLPEGLNEFADLKRLVIANSQNLLDLPDSISRLTHLEELNLRNLANFNALNAGIGKLQNLRKLILFYCTKLDAVPDSIGDLSRLEHLEIYGSRIKALPASLSRLKNLKYVDIADVNLGRVPDFSASRSLKVLKLSGVGMAGPLPAWILKLPKLTELNVSGNALTEIPREILNLPLKRCNVQKNPLTYPPASQIKGGWKGMVEWFARNEGAGKA